MAREASCLLLAFIAFSVKAPRIIAMRNESLISESDTNVDSSQEAVFGHEVNVTREHTRGRGGYFAIFAGYVPLAPYPIIVYSVANHRPHLSHF